MPLDHTNKVAEALEEVLLKGRQSSHDFWAWTVIVASLSYFAIRVAPVVLNHFLVIR